MNPVLKYTLALSALISICSCKKESITFHPDNPVAQDFVHVQNGQLLDSLGQPLRMNGVNLGGWLLWESWIWGGGLNSETSIMQTLANRTDETYAQNFRQSIYSNYITQEDIDAIAALGMNTVRVPFNHSFFDNGVTSGELLDARFEMLDDLIQWCDEAGIYVILDCHGLPGGQNNLFISDPDLIKVWNSDEHKSQSVKIWKAIAQRYVNNKTVLGYDLMNEPAAPSNMDMVSLYSEMIVAIRSADPNHLIIVEGGNYAQDFSVFNTVMDNNQIFSFHFYGWLLSSEARLQKLSEYNNFAQAVDAPMWCGEWGETSPGDLQDIKNLLTDEQYSFCGEAFWTWKKVKVNDSSYPLNEIVVNEQWLKLINNQPKTTNDTYEQIADSFLAAILYENNIPGEVQGVLGY